MPPVSIDRIYTIEEWILELISPYPTNAAFQRALLRKSTSIRLRLLSSRRPPMSRLNGIVHAFRPIKWISISIVMPRRRSTPRRE